jgi:arginyl-tRNA synthetase
LSAVGSDVWDSLVSGDVFGDVHSAFISLSITHRLQHFQSVRTPLNLVTSLHSSNHCYRYAHACLVSPLLLPLVGDHPDVTAPKNWHVVEVSLSDGDDKTHTVVCGGEGYAVGDVIAYIPNGGVAKGKTLSPKDMQGVMSHGMMVAYAEVGAKAPAADVKAAEERAKAAADAAAAAAAAAAPADAPVDDAEKGGKKKKKGKKGGANKGKGGAGGDAGARLIYKLPADTTVGIELTELGRLADKDMTYAMPADVKVSAHVTTMNDECKAMLKLLEARDESSAEDQLFQKTRTWSLDEFKQIYEYLNARFDHNFYESDVGDESRELVKEFRDKGVFNTADNGAIIADLEKFKLGFLILLKSTGAGLYATKDLSLAKRKFNDFNVDKCVYVVDASQTLHFKQVFKCLEMMGFEQAKQCFHLPYGMVVLPEGKMSSRKGTVIMFSALKNMLSEQIETDFLAKYREGNDAWPEEEVETAKRIIAVATIKYGMLHHPTDKDIVFDLKEWAAKSGNTGPYQLYAYARCRSIVREVEADIDVSLVDYNLLSGTQEREILMMINEYWYVVETTARDYSPTRICGYVYSLAKLFSSFYESSSVKNAETAALKATRAHFVMAIAEMLKHALGMLGIDTIERM